MDDECMRRPKGAMFSSKKDSNKDLVRAAEAVVDAAIWCHRLQDDGDVTEEFRQSLIEAVFDDPMLTPELFQKGRLIMQ